MKNPHWDPATDPNRSQLADKIVVNLNVNADRIDQNLIHNFAHLDLSGTGVGTAARAQILASASLKKNTEKLTNLGLFDLQINTKVKPLDNLHSRRAVEYAADKGHLPDRLRRPGRRREHRQHDTAPLPDRLQEIRPLRGDRQTTR